MRRDERRAIGVEAGLRLPKLAQFRHGRHDARPYCDSRRRHAATAGGGNVMTRVVATSS
jgi:hypothetical protein